MALLVYIQNKALILLFWCKCRITTKMSKFLISLVSTSVKNGNIRKMLSIIFRQTTNVCRWVKQKMNSLQRFLCTTEVQHWDGIIGNDLSRIYIVIDEYMELKEKVSFHISDNQWYIIKYISYRQLLKQGKISSMNELLPCDFI